MCGDYTRMKGILLVKSEKTCMIFKIGFTKCHYLNLLMREGFTVAISDIADLNSTSPKTESSL
jgi:hypothetical protein